jgi:hypothetical protein
MAPKPHTVYFGKAPVPWSAMWSSEAEYSVGWCEWFGVSAIVQKEAQCQGEPLFSQPNVNRQRRLHAQGLCDLCAKELRGHTRLSLSRFIGPALVQDGEKLTAVEPLIHRDCARKALEVCPSLRRQLAEKALRVRQVFRSEARPTIALPCDIKSFVPGYTGPPITGMGVVDILDWRDITTQFV